MGVANIFFYSSSMKNYVWFYILTLQINKQRQVKVRILNSNLVKRNKTKVCKHQIQQSFLHSSITTPKLLTFLRGGIHIHVWTQGPQSSQAIHSTYSNSSRIGGFLSPHTQHSDRRSKFNSGVSRNLMAFITGHLSTADYWTIVIAR